MVPNMVSNTIPDMVPDMIPNTVSYLGDHVWYQICDTKYTVPDVVTAFRTHVMLNVIP